MPLDRCVRANGFGSKTATAATAIVRLLPPFQRGRTQIYTLTYTTGTTAHTVIVLRSIGRTTLTASAAAGQAIVTVAVNPGPAGNALAAGDYVAIREMDGVTRVYVVSSITGLKVTMTTNLVAGAGAGADLWDFGLPTDTDPTTGEPHPGLACPASASTTFTDRAVGVLGGFRRDEPLLVYSANPTAAGTLAQVSYTYDPD